ncbi:MAG: T9SS type A sorting domain-containing protein, partial [Bacteroidales bacterium]
YALNLLQKLTFANGNLLVTPYNGSVNQVSIADIRYLNFVDLMVAIPKNQLPDYFSIYPNPTSSELRIVNEKSLIQEIELFDMSGKRLYQNNQYSQFAIMLDVSYLIPGVYLLKILTDQGSVTRKIVKK